jgi:ATP-dependent Clp protease protease subunit
MSFQMPSSRYILPSFVERTSYGMKESNPYNKLFEERIIFLGVQIDDASANDVMAQLITLESATPTATSRSTSTRPVARSRR